MAAIATLVSSTLLAPKLKVAVVNVAMDNSYAGTKETCDLSAIFDNVVMGGFPIEFDAQQQYKLAYVPGAAGAPASGGIAASYYDNDLGADGPAIDVAGAVNLSTCDGSWVFLGY
jgi:hypothetical protein